jgi:hypothetical protein
VYRQVEPNSVVETVARLQRRIAERFPDSGLSRVAAEVHDVSLHSAARARWAARPLVSLRIGMALLLAVVLAVLIGAIGGIDVTGHASTVFELLQGIESGINDLIFLGLGVFFLTGLEARIKRARVLDALHELRALAHVIDMHQLTKDPDRVLATGPDTEGSPERVLGRFETGRYLDYCSELLALIGKIAALYAQSTTDAVSLAGVDQIEDLTSRLASKIWQKIQVLHLNP